MAMGGGNFARGFSNTFGASYALAQKRSENNLDRMWETFKTNKKTYDDAQMTATKNQKVAEEIARAVGAPVDATPIIRKSLDAGIDVSQVYKMYEKQNWNKTDVDPAGQIKPVDAQTGAAMTEGQAPNEESYQQPGMPPAGATNQMPPDPNGIKGFVNKLVGKKDPVQQIADNAGISYEEAQQMLDGNPQLLNPLQTNEPVPNYTLTPQSETQVDPTIVTERMKQQQQVAEKLYTDAKPYKQKANTMVSVVKDAGDISDIVQGTNGAVLSDTVAGGAQIIDKWRSNLRSVKTLFVPEASGDAQLDAAQNELASIRTAVDNKEMDLNTAITGIEKTLEQYPVADRIGNLAQAKTLMNMKVQLMAYKIGTLYGQDGRALSQAENAVFQQIAQSGNTPDKFYQNISNLINSQTSILEGERQNLLGHGTLVGYEVSNNGEQYPKNAVEKIVGVSVDDMLAADPRTSKVMNDLKTYNTTKIGTPLPATLQGIKDIRGNPIPSGALQLLMKDPSMADAFEQKYGVRPKGF